MHTVLISFMRGLGVDIARACNLGEHWNMQRVGGKGRRAPSMQRSFVWVLSERQQLLGELKPVCPSKPAVDPPFSRSTISKWRTWRSPAQPQIQSGGICLQSRTCLAWLRDVWYDPKYDAIRSWLLVAIQSSMANQTHGEKMELLLLI